MRKFLCGLALVAVSGCAAFRGSSPLPPEVLAAGDAGALCVLVKTQAPKELEKARLALTCAEGLFGGPVDLAAVAKCASEAGVPEQYEAIVALAISRIQARTGFEGSVLPPDSKAAVALKAFFETCAIALG